ncbi:helix-turn-helix domain-containing protein [Streptomyces sp. Y1]|uniref:Helix-turn-helix domain-containing protein n=1 Tax=Streptomyces sp. Y1 TaxID=3238634 RepID=A0AB39TQB7_9ACTN
MAYLLGVKDLAATRCGYSPLHETVRSLRLRSPNGGHAFPEQRGWAAGWARDHAGLDTDLLDTLLTPGGLAPEALTPRPRSCRPCIQDELSALAATPADRLCADFRAAYARDGSPLPPLLARLLDDPYALRARLVTALGQYWTRCLEPAWWPRARTVLEADLAHRGRRLAESGAAGLFADLDPRVSWADGTLRVHGDPSGADPSGAPAPVRREPIAGRGLVLMPTLFADRAFGETSPSGTPAIVYPARGRGTMAEGSTAEGAIRAAASGGSAVSGALAELIGAARARVLGLLDTPATTTALAYRLGVTPGAVSRHLGALAAAGLLERTRTGRAVHYRRSPLGESLVGASTLVPA